MAKQWITTSAMRLGIAINSCRSDLSIKDAKFSLREDLAFLLLCGTCSAVARSQAGGALKPAKSNETRGKVVKTMKIKFGSPSWTRFELWTAEFYALQGDRTKAIRSVGGEEVADLFGTGS